MRTVVRGLWYEDCGMRTVVRGLWYEDCGMRTGMLTGSMAA